MAEIEELRKRIDRLSRRWEIPDNSELLALIEDLLKIVEIHIAKPE